MRKFLLLIFIHAFLFSHFYAQADINDWNAVVYYVKTRNLNVRNKPNPKARKVGAFKRYQKIVGLITSEDYGNWVKVIYPIKGYVYGKYLIPAEDFDVSPRRISKKVKRLNNYFVEEIEYPETDFTVDDEGGIDFDVDEVEKFLLLHKANSTKIIYPFEGKLNTSPEEIAESDYKIPETENNNWTFEERHVRAYYLNLRTRPSERAEIITTLEKNQKIVLVNVNGEKITPGWGRVIYPLEGYVYKKYLYSKQLADSSELENDWRAALQQNGDFPFAVFLDSTLTQPVDTIAPNRTYLEVLKNKPSRIRRIIFPVKGYAIPEENVIAEFEEDAVPGWNYEERYVKASFLNVRTRPSQRADIISVVKKYQKVLILNTDQKITRGWKQVLYPVAGFLYAPYLYKKSEESEIEDEIRLRENAWNADILRCAVDSSFIFREPNEESERIGTIRKNEQAIFVVDSLREENWLAEVFPKSGYVRASDFDFTYSAKVAGESYLAAGILVGPYQLPIEKNMSNYKIPLGAVIDYSPGNWGLAFRLGFFQTQTHLNEYVLKTNQIYLTLRYSFLHLIENSLEFYAGAGANYWMSKFQYTKYPELEEYFKECENSDFGYSLSAGLMYTYKNFFIDLQYYFWSSREAVFKQGSDADEFATEYKLYPGSNQFNVIVGYKFKL